MMKKMRKNIIILAMFVFLAVPVSVYAKSSTRSVTLSADYATGKGKLECKFQWKIFGKDSADAYTEITKREKNSPTNYRVAVRLETWKTSKKCTKYSYKNGRNKASLSASNADVYQYASRHSLDDNSNTKELAARSIYAPE